MEAAAEQGGPCRAATTAEPKAGLHAKGPRMPAKQKRHLYCSEFLRVAEGLSQRDNPILRTLNEWQRGSRHLFRSSTDVGLGGQILFPNKPMEATVRRILSCTPFFSNGLNFLANFRGPRQITKSVVGPDRW